MVRLWQCLLAASVVLALHQVMAAAGPRVIYGDDDRLDYYQLTSEEIKNQSDSTVALVRTASLDPTGNIINFKTLPYGQSMGLCPAEPFYNQETLAFCSGSLVAPDIILTAGHCIRNQESCNSTKFVFGFRVTDPSSLPKKTTSDLVFSCKTLIHSVADPLGEDFALARMDRPVTHVKPLGYRTQGVPAVGDALRVMGHPAGLPLKVAGGATVRALKGQYLVANLDTYGGNSGSPVLNAADGKLEGVLVRGEMDYITKNGCRVSNVCAPDGCRGEDVTLMERIVPILTGATNP